MDGAQRAFMSEVLGEAGARALERAAVRDPRVSAALLPRVALALVTQCESYTGIAGSFAKSERGYLGSVTFRGRARGFEGAGAPQLAAALALALGVSEVPRVDPAVLRRLGKSVDALARARRKGKARKTEEPGQTAGPKAPEAPTAPAGPKPAPARTSRHVTVAKSDALNACPLCRRAQLADGAFVGCLCFRDLSKSVSVSEVPGAYELELGPAWDDDAEQALREAVGG